MDLARFTSNTRTLHDLVQSGAEVLDVVILDEFTYDVVARVEDQLLVFDTT